MVPPPGLAPPSLGGPVLVAPPPGLGASLSGQGGGGGLTATSLGAPGGTPGVQRARQSSLTSQMAARYVLGMRAIAFGRHILFLKGSYTGVHIRSPFLS